MTTVEDILESYTVFRSVHPQIFLTREADQGQKQLVKTASQPLLPQRQTHELQRIISFGERGALTLSVFVHSLLAFIRWPIIWGKTVPIIALRVGCCLNVGRSKWRPTSESRCLEDVN